jgi:hypothetical protein
MFNICRHGILLRKFWILVAEMSGRDHLENKVINGRRVKKQIPEKPNIRMSTGF